MNTLLPQDALFDGNAEPWTSLPVCDHYAGIEKRMIKSLEMQAEMGPVFDVTLDAEDGAPIGGENDHIELIASIVNSEANLYNRVGARVHPVTHPAFENDVRMLFKHGISRLAYLMLPKARNLDDVRNAIAFISRCADEANAPLPPLHALIETHGALHDVWSIASLAQIQSLSFGLMDFVSAHGGAIPAQGMGAQGQFTHPLVVRAKLEIAASCHAHGKTPSHSVITEFNNAEIVFAAARKASQQFGYTRMWSIHPSQIRPIVDAFKPDLVEINDACQILMLAYQNNWAPIRYKSEGQDSLHDRASYRYYWHILRRAKQTGCALPQEVEHLFFEHQ